MNERICPKCKIIYTNGQKECEECGKLLRNATEDELYEHGKSMNKKLDKASNKSESITPDLWQIISSAVLLLYGIILVVFFGKAHASLLILNIIYATVILMPRIFQSMGYHNYWDFLARDPHYVKIGRIVTLCFIALCNIVYTYQLIFPSNN